MLNFAEEIVLLAIDHNTGRFLPLPERALDIALAGALIMGLVEKKRIDPDLAALKVLDTSPTEEKLLDEVLTNLAAHPQYTLSEHINAIAAHSHHIREIVLQGLVEKGILKHEEEKFLWVVTSDRYPVLDDQEERQVKHAIRKVLLENTTPTPQDVAIICLMHACDLSHAVLSEEDVRAKKTRIEEIIQQDVVGTAIVAAIEEIQHTFNEVVSHSAL